MSKLKFNLDPSFPLPDVALSDPRASVGMPGGSVEYDGDLTAGDIRFSFGVSRGASIEVFNSLDDKDADGVIGPRRREESVTATELSMPLVLTDKNAWLKYRCEAKPHVSVAATAGPVHARIDTSFAVIFGDYRIHERFENARDAILGDLRNLRLAALPEDVLSLKPGEALSYQTRGELAAGVSLSWSDVFASNLTQFSRLISSREVIALEFAVGASVSFDVSIEDDFRVVFSREDTGQILVSVHKSDSRATGLKAAAGVKVQFSNQAAVEEALLQPIKALTGHAVAVIDEILSRASLDDLNEDERRIVSEILNRISLDDVLSTIEDVRARWDEFKKKVTAAATTVARAKVEMGFKYEFSRLQVEDALLEVVIDDGNVRTLHGDLMRCDLRPLLAWARENPSALRRYLHQQVIERTQAWGFTLGIGPWRLSGKDHKSLRAVTQRDAADRLKIAYCGSRGYEGKGFRDSDAWTVDFRAEMDDFSTNGLPQASEFEYGLHLKFDWTEAKLSRSEIDKYVDAAAIWRVIGASEKVKIVNQIGSRLGKEARVTLEIRIDNEEFRKLLPLVTSAGDDQLARALARGMPFLQAYTGRADSGLREQFYSELWAEYLRKEWTAGTEMGQAVAAHIDRISEDRKIDGGRALAQLERGNSISPAFQDFRTFSGQVYYHSRLRSDMKALMAGLAELDAALDPVKSKSHELIGDVYKKLSRFFSQSLYIRTLGTLLVDTAGGSDDLLDRIERVLTITADGRVTVITSRTGR